MKKEIFYPKAYEIQLKDKDALKESASGGFFTAISDWVIDQGGIVCGAAYNNDFKVVHRLTDKKKDCISFRGSKYVQSEIGTVYNDIKTELEKGRLCLFSGVPCQVYGLLQFLGKKYENLLTVDLVCAGVPSPMLWKCYLEMQEENYGASVTYANFRHKTFGYQSSTLRLEFENGRIYSKSGRIDPMMKSFVNGMTKRPACYCCGFKGINRPSDFTLFDGWHAATLMGKPDNNKGYTTVLVHTRVAELIFNVIQSMESVEVDVFEALSADGIMVNELPTKHKYRTSYYESLCKSGIRNCIKVYSKILIQDRVIEFMKPFIHRMGLIKAAKRVKRILK